MTRVNRTDSLQIRQDSLTRTPQGFLKVDGYATRLGVFEYPTGNELRPAEEVLKQDSLQTLANVPVTFRHPPQMLNPKNTARYQKGYTADKVDAENDLIKVTLIVTDSDLIDRIERGDVQELSCGYTCKMDEESGYHDGQRYDAIQRDIVYNHLAVVPKGRAGSRVKIKTDEETFMITIKGKKFETEEAAQNAVDSLVEKSDEAQQLANDAQAKIDAIQAKLDEAESKAAKAQERIDFIDSTINSKVAELVALRTEAAKHLPKEFKFDGLNEVEIKSAVITARHDGLSLEGKSPEYINARYDAIIELPVIDKQSRVDSAIEAVGKGSSGQLNFNPVLAARQANNNKRLGA